MDTRSAQLSVMINEVISDFIHGGQIPLISNVFREVIRRLKGHTLGTPFAVPDTVKYNSPTNPEKYNKLFEGAVEDINLLYNLITDQLRRLVTDMDYMMTWRSRVKSKIKQLHSDIIGTNAGPPFSYHNNFSNLCGTNY